MTEQHRPGDENGQHVNRYPGAPAQPHFPAMGPQQPAAPRYPTAPQAVPPHQGWTGQHVQQPVFDVPAGGPFGGTQHGGGLPPLFTPGGPTGTLPPAAPRRTGRWRIAVAGLAAGALIGGGAGAGVVTLLGNPSSSSTSATAAQNVVITDPQNATSATAAAAKAEPSVVTVYVADGSGSGSGSGVVLTDDGYVLTNNHVVTLDSSTTSATVQVTTSDGKLYDATVVGTDPTSDLAVIKLSDASGLTPATFADSTKVQVGDQAVAIGAPLGLSNTVTTGIVSALDRAVATGSDTNTTVIDAIQTDAAINPGNSGGALVNAAGEVIGINSAIATVASGQSSQESQSGNIGVGFAIPSDTAQRVAQQIIQTGSATHALLGVSAQTASQSGSEVGEGAQVAQVAADGPAAEAGLQVGDVITAVGDREITTSTELTAAVRSASPGDEVSLTVRRGSSTSTVDVTLGTASS
ncbi:putative serine protease PepD [Klenkia soli]|uniref:Putative serine protease PepD n=1 Tax=Klenkia soli TaxID=1052260 RepID=A0A1H0JPA2_9ACTN|nr:trypsin-like peptidase domain-containing protein [Klenkia soli]SDO45191.1 putative serine protease PepD [Klenkia soli]